MLRPSSEEFGHELRGTDREWAALNRLDSLCRSKGWRLSLRCEHDAESTDPENLNVVEVSHDVREEKPKGGFRAGERDLIPAASLRNVRIGLAAEALAAQMTKAGLFAVMVLAASATFVAAASGGVDRASDGRVDIRMTLCSTPKLIQTKPFPRSADVIETTAYVNGHRLQSWMEAPRTIGLGGYGVIAQITFTRKAGPAVVRLASARSGCARVRVFISWALSENPAG